MAEQLPIWLSLLFILVTITVIIFFHLSNVKLKRFTFLIVLWSIFHAVLSYFGFYQSTGNPPRFGLILIPFFTVIILSLIPKYRNKIIAQRNLKASTFLHAIRLPVEIGLHHLFLISLLPISMTYEGLNFDIIMGITALIIGFLFYKNLISRKLLLAWNIIGLGFIIVIFMLGILSAELPFQQFAFDQPNRAVTLFPITLLPATIVPLVIWTHLTDILKLIYGEKNV